MICLDDDDLNPWHNHYIGRSTWRQPAAAARTLTLEDTRRATQESKNAAGYASCRKHRSELMPGFYLIFNSRRAIIVTPFFIPPHPLTPLKMENPETQGVQMFGFETTDSRIIEDVSRLFKYYWDSPENEPCYFDSQSSSADGIPARVAEKLEKWASDPAFKGKCLRYRVFIEEEDPWTKILSYLRTKVSSEDYLNYLDRSAASAEKDTLRVFVGTVQQREWIEAHCRKAITEAAEIVDLRMRVEVVVGQPGVADSVTK
jgi:hypothetical protein